MFNLKMPSFTKIRFSLFLAALIFSIMAPVACKKEKQPTQLPSNEVVIWTYSSFVSEWGPGEDVTKAFEESTGLTINWVNHGDSGEILSRLLLEGEKSGADIILGLDQNQAERILESGLLEAYRPRGAENIASELILDPSFRLIPMDYSYFAFVYDSEKIPEPPKNLEELTAEKYKDKIILIDPRTSTVGLGFFGWVKEVYGPAWPEYWQRIKPSLLTVAEGWSSAYGLFTRGEAPLVLSYTTSPGVHLEYEGTERYRAAIFTDGHPLQIEAAGLLKSAKNKKNAKAFLDFMLTMEFQNVIPLTNWMYPVTDIPLPPSFRINQKSDKPLRPETASEAEFNEWAALMR